MPKQTFFGEFVIFSECSKSLKQPSQEFLPIRAQKTCLQGNTLQIKYNRNQQTDIFTFKSSMRDRC